LFASILFSFFCDEKEWFEFIYSNLQCILVMRESCGEGKERRLSTFILYNFQAHAEIAP
jgi:hypothetical protein